MRVGATVFKAKGAEVRLAARRSACERRAASELTEDLMTPWASQVHHFLDVPPHSEHATLLLRLGSQLRQRDFEASFVFTLQYHVLEIVAMALKRLEGERTGMFRRRLESK